MILLASCATQKQHQIYQKKSSLMMLDNTHMKRNSKYYSNSYRRHVKQNTIKKQK
jgi:hypothetical protein